MDANRVTIRFSPNQMQVLTELKEKLNSSYALIIRSMVLDFLTRNEDCIERILDGIDNNEVIFDNNAND